MTRWGPLFLFWSQEIGNISFDHMTLIVTFDLLLKNFNKAHNFFTVRDGYLKGHNWAMNVAPFPRVMMILDTWGIWPEEHPYWFGVKGQGQI